MKKLPKQISTLIDAITNNKIQSVKPGAKLQLGNLLCWVYNAKTKATLPVWDKLPLVILLDIPKRKYILGINVHFIPWTYRINFVKSLQANGTKVKYKDIKRAWQEAKIPGAYASLAIRKYLLNRIQSNIKIFRDPKDQMEIVKNVLPDFQKMPMAATYKAIDKRIKAQRQKNKAKK